MTNHLIQRLSTDRSWWRRCNPVVRVGCVQVTPVSHLVALGYALFLAWSIASQVPTEADRLGLTTANAPAVAVLVYLLFQAGRVIHEAGHALIGVHTGRRINWVRLSALQMAVDFPDGDLEQAPAMSRRLTALAGSTAEATFGLGLLAAVTVFGERWAPIVAETVFLFGLVHVAALANLLPLAHMDGEQLFGRAWHTRPAWLGLAPAIVLTFPLPAALTALRFPDGYTQAYVTWLTSGGGYVPLILCGLITLPLLRRVLVPAPSTQVRTAQGGSTSPST